MCNDDSQTASATPTENLDNSGDCVKKSKHIFEDQNCHPGGLKGLADNDDFDLWTSLGSVNEFQNYGSLPESVKKIHTQKQGCLLFKIDSSKAHKNRSCQNFHYGWANSKTRNRVIELNRFLPIGTPRESQYWPISRNRD